MSISTPQSLANALQQLEVACEGLEFADAHFNLGKMAELQGRYENALHHFERAASHREKPEYLEALGAVHFRLGREEQAIEILERLLVCDGRAETHLRLAEALAKQGARRDEVVLHLKAAATATASDSSYFKKLGSLCLAEGLDDLAARVLGQGLSLTPTDGALCLELARAYLMGGHYDQAFSHPERAIVLEPRNAETRVVYGDMLLSLGRWHEAIAQFREGSELDPTNMAALLGEADASLEAGCYQEAATLYQKLTAMSEADIRPFIGLASALSHMKFHFEAIKVLEGACRLNHDNHQLSFNLGVAYLETNELAKAEVAFLDALRKHPKDPLSRFYLKRIWERRGDESNHSVGLS